MPRTPAVIDALDRPHPETTAGTRWQLVADTVMGGVSAGRMTRETVGGRPAVRLAGRVSLENDGGFLQLALDLAPDGGPVDASGFAGIEMDVLGNGERYNVHLRTADVMRPWQSYRHPFETAPAWRTLRLPFDDFVPHRVDAPLDTATLRRIGIVAIGRAFDADVAVGRLGLYAA